tara:strand:+ start:251 stop:472 length:222 start_codon:yes stop_codon:yes gene_type:complete
MKRLLLPLLAALALPTAVSAESYWLILTDHKTYAYEKIEMESMDQCEEQGKIFMELTLGSVGRTQRYACLKGK